jgi:hypothetical protein
MQTTPRGFKKPQDTDNADLKIFVGDNMDLLETELNKVSAIGGERESFLVYQTVAQNVVTGTFTKVSFDTVMFDKASGWDATNKRYVVQNDGIYGVISSVNWQNSTDGCRTVMELRKNGSSLVWMTQEHAGSNKHFSGTGMTNIQAVAGDIIEIFIWHDAPISMDTTIIGTPANASTFFSMVKQG